MIQQLKVLTTPAKDPGTISSTLMRQITTIWNSSSGDPMPQNPLAPHICSVHKLTQAHIYTHNKQLNLKVYIQVKILRSNKNEMVDPSLIICQLQLKENETMHNDPSNPRGRGKGPNIQIMLVNNIYTFLKQSMFIFYTSHPLPRQFFKTLISTK